MTFHVEARGGCFGGDEAESKGKSKILTIRLLISDEGVWVERREHERNTIPMIVLMALITSSVTAEFVAFPMFVVLKLCHLSFSFSAFCARIVFSCHCIM